MGLKGLFSLGKETHSALHEDEKSPSNRIEALAGILRYNNRGIAYKRLIDYERAIQDFTKAIELYPNFEAAQKNREQVLWQCTKARRWWQLLGFFEATNNSK